MTLNENTTKTESRRPLPHNFAHILIVWYEQLQSSISQITRAVIDFATRTGKYWWIQDQIFYSVIMLKWSLACLVMPLTDQLRQHNFIKCACLDNVPALTYFCLTLSHTECVYSLGLASPTDVFTLFYGERSAWCKFTVLWREVCLV